MVILPLFETSWFPISKVTRTPDLIDLSIIECTKTRSTPAQSYEGQAQTSGGPHILHHICRRSANSQACLTGCLKPPCSSRRATIAAREPTPSLAKTRRR